MNLLWCQVYTFYYLLSKKMSTLLPEGTDVHIQQHIHQKHFNLCLPLSYYGKVIVNKCLGELFPLLSFEKFWFYICGLNLRPTAQVTLLHLFPANTQRWSNVHICWNNVATSVNKISMLIQCRFANVDSSIKFNVETTLILGDSKNNFVLISSCFKN